MDNGFGFHLSQYIYFGTSARAEVVWFSSFVTTLEKSSIVLFDF